jgi:hypothetical protein
MSVLISPADLTRTPSARDVLDGMQPSREVSFFGLAERDVDGGVEEAGSIHPIVNKLSSHASSRGARGENALGSPGSARKGLGHDLAYEGLSTTPHHATTGRCISRVRVGLSRGKSDEMMEKGKTVRAWSSKPNRQRRGRRPGGPNGAEGWFQRTRRRS